MDPDEQSLPEKIKNFLAIHSQFRNPAFDPAPFLIQILKEKQGDHEAILDRRKDLIELENQAYDLVDQICAQYSDDFLRLLSIPSKQAQQLQKLKSSISVVKKKTRQTKLLLMNTQKDIDEVSLNCIFNKTVYKKLKLFQLKLYQYDSASLALKNNQFFNCSLNLPSFQARSILQSALANKTQNLKLTLLAKAIEEVSIFLYLTPKVILPTSLSLIERISSQQNIFGNLTNHEGFHKRYNLFKKANSIKYLQTIWNFKQLDMKKGKIHLMYDIINGVMNIGKINEILYSLELDCKKSIKSIYLLLQFYFSLDYEEEIKSKFNYKINLHFEKQSQMSWFLCQKNTSHIQFISTVLNVTGVILRKLIILRLILKEQFSITCQQLSNLQTNSFLQLSLKQLNQMIQFIYIEQNIQNIDFIHEQILKKIKINDNYILWANIRNILIKSLIIIDENLLMLEEQYKLSNQKINKFKWNQIVMIQQFDKKFYKKFYIQFNQTLEQIFNHQGKSFAFQSLEEITAIMNLNQIEISFCRYCTSEQMKYSKQYVFAISLFGQVERFFKDSNFDQVQCKKYQLYILSVLYLKVNYYLQRYFLSNKSLEKAFQIRKTSNKLKTKQKDYKRQLDKISIRNKKFQNIIRPWKKNRLDDIQQSKYRLVENLKGIKQQNQMLFAYCSKKFTDLEKFKQSQNVISQISVYDKLEPANYDQNFSSKLIKIWDQLPEIQTSVIQLTLSLFQKFIEFQFVIEAIIYLECSVQ